MVLCFWVGVSVREGVGVYVSGYTCVTLPFGWVRPGFLFCFLAELFIMLDHIFIIILGSYILAVLNSCDINIYMCISWGRGLNLCTKSRINMQIGGLGMKVDLGIHPQLLMCGQVYGDDDHTDEHADRDG